AVSESEKKAENTISTDMIIISIVIHESIGYLINSYNIDKVKNLTANGESKILGPVIKKQLATETRRSLSYYFSVSLCLRG
ncbi:MAG: hypothetical protein OIN85_05465, partial [Candidatus Methanoperedens sp.]|nr:hypothetical protein [Candidatus Methanoperedens sp.]